MFDLDGVVLDSMTWHIRAWQELFSSMGIKVDDEVLYLNEGAIEHSHLKDKMSEHGFKEPNLINGLLSKQAAIFNAKYSSLVAPFPDASAVMDRLTGSGLALALVTSSSGQVVDRSLPKELLSKFATVVTGDAVSQGKPHPEPYLTALARLDLPARAGLAVENAPAGIRSARDAGLVCFALTTTLAAKHLSGAQAVFGSLTHLAQNLLLGRPART
ncbi:MAG: HAD family phosphatase [Deltaproteobacteria bacterium]|nr:HAD family phosphatase [Deltaproteobacteria bacterium]